MKPSLLLFLILLTVFLQCKSSSTPHQSVDDRIASIVGNGYTISKNQSGTFALCLKPSDLSLSYKVVRLTDFKVVIDETVPKGSVSWSSDLTIKVETTPGIVRADEPINNTRTIDLSRFILNEN